MFCLRYRKLLSPYVEGELEESLRARVEKHIAGCAACAAEVRILSRVSEALRTARPPALEPADDLRARVGERIAGLSTRRARARIAVSQATAAFAAAVVIIVVGIAMTLPDIDRASDRVVKDYSARVESKSAPFPHVGSESGSVRTRAAVRPTDSVAGAPSSAARPHSPPAMPPADKTRTADIARHSPVPDARPAPPSVGSVEPAANARILPVQAKKEVASIATPTGAATDSVLSLDNSRIRAPSGSASAGAEQILNTDPDAAILADIALIEKDGLESARAETRAAAQRLSAAKPRDPRLWIRLAAALERIGDLSSAEQAYRNATDCNDPATAAAAKKRLEEMKR